MNVVADMKGRVVLPGGMADIERRHDDPLAITGDEMQSGFDEIEAWLEGNDAVEDRHAANMKRRFFRLKVKEDGVFRAEPVTAMKMRHVEILLWNMQEALHVTCR